MVNGLIKINDDYQVDFSFIDKVLTHMVGLKKQELLQALSISNVPTTINQNSSMMLNDQSQPSFDLDISVGNRELTNNSSMVLMPTGDQSQDGQLKQVRIDLTNSPQPSQKSP